MATGPNFEDMKKPYVAVRVGKIDDVGDIEITDVMFTARGPTAGAVLVEWNVKAASQGSAGMWDCVIRVGGAHGTGQQITTFKVALIKLKSMFTLLEVFSPHPIWDSPLMLLTIANNVTAGFLIEGPGPTRLLRVLIIKVSPETESCQSRVLQISQSTGVHTPNLMTKASLAMATRWNGHPAWAVDNHNAYGSTIAAWVLNQKSTTDGSGVIGPGGSYTQKIGARFWETRRPDYPLIVGLSISQGPDYSNATNMTSIFGDGLLGDDNGRGCSGTGCGCTGANCGSCHGPKCGKPPGRRTGCDVNTDGGCKGTNCNSGCRDKHCEEVTASLVLTMYAFQVHVPASTVPPGGGEGEQEEGEEDEDDEADSCPLIRLPPTVSTSSGDQAYEINPPAGSSGWKSPPEVNNGGGGSTTTGGPPEPTLDPDPFAQRFEIWARTQMKGPAFIEQWNSGTEGRNKFQRCQNALERVTMELDVTGWPSVVSPIEHLRLWSGLQECTWTPKSGLNWEAENASAWIGDIMI
ncbi:hypothetical protein TWF788_001902 [Orbilia oligospora]|uniref:Uncharacterized protein n=1 Tax=Orbilia oligospora TaxID=2813651 RepID=A0A7C8TZA3_ORBOL|nr:hypothetical protein TWF788_001902 [Orbilia oligospora]